MKTLSFAFLALILALTGVLLIAGLPIQADPLPYLPQTAPWDANRQVSTVGVTATQERPALAVGSTGALYAAWMDYRDTGYSAAPYVARSTNDGSTWGSNVQVSSSHNANAVPAIAASGSLTVHLAWQQNGPSNWWVYYNRSGDGGQTWGADQGIHINGGPASSGENVDIATGNAGRVYVVWTGNNVVRLARSTDGGDNWSTATQIITPTVSLTGKPALAVDVTGTLHLAWTEWGTGWDICYARSSDGGTTWSNLACGNDTGDQQKPDIAVDAVSGWVHAVWEDNRSGNSEIYYVSSPTGGLSWGTAAKISGTGSPAVEPAVAAYDNGLVYVVWQDGRNGDDDIYYARSLDGGHTWGTPGRVNDDAGTQPQRHPAIAHGSGVYAIWDDQRAGDADIFAASLITSCPVSLAGVSLSGGSEITPGDSLILTAAISPTSATGPVVYTWSLSPVSGQGTTQATYVWSQPGHYTPTITAANCGGSFEASHPVTVTCSAPVTGVSITGPTTTAAGVPVTLNAVVSPDVPRTPITYVWSPAPAAGQGTAQTSYSWQDVGPHGITVTATNCSGDWGIFSGAHTVTVSDNTAPGWSSFTPTGWVTGSQTVNVAIHVQDTGSGLDVSTAQVAYSINGGGAWTTWSAATISGADWVTTPQTVTVSIAFGQDSGTGHLNRVKFRINDMAGKLGESSVYNVDIDTAPPTNPSTLTGDRNTSTWSNNATAVMSWSGASDGATGSDIQGYSYQWSTSNTTIPDTVMDTASSSASTTIPSDGTSWYFHVRAVDNAGNWASGAIHAGPYWLDTYPPATPSVYSSTPVTDVWSIKNNVYVSFGGSSDPGGSGPGGYSYLWDTSPSTIPDTTTDTGNISSPLADGIYYFHIRARDVAGNWTPTVHYGPFKIDRAAPAAPGIVSSNPAINAWTTDNTIDVTWSAAADANGISGYAYDWTRWPVWSAHWTTDTAGLNATSAPLADGTWYFHIHARDQAGNWSTITHYGPFQVDVNPPSNPNPSSISHPLNGWSTKSVITETWSGAYDGLGSGVHGYSFVWDHSPGTLPDMTEDTTGTSDSRSLGDGIWYFHIRTRDVAGNWNGSAAHNGPYFIDTAPPSNPTSLTSSSHTPSVWSNKSTVAMNWSGASDGSGSGIWGYSYVWDNAPTTLPDTILDTTGITATHNFYTGNSWYFHLRTVDKVGNWTSNALHYGPFWIDIQTPHCSPQSPYSANSLSFNVNWAGTDPGSGVAGFDLQYKDTSVGTNWQPWKTNTLETSAAFTGDHGHVYQFRCRARDKVGNVEDWPYSYDSETGIATLDWAVIGLEVTQAVQDLNNSVELIANKRAFARFHVRSLGYATQQPITARLMGERWENGGWQPLGVPLTNNPGGAITILANPDRGVIGDSFYFDLPADWLHGSLQLTAEVNPDRRWAESDYSNNVFWQLNLDFTQVQPMNVMLINACYVQDSITYNVRDADKWALESWLRRAYPISTLNVSWWNRLPCWPHLWGDKELLHNLIWIQGHQSIQGQVPWTRWYGMADDGGGPLFMVGWSQTPGTVGTGPAGPGTWGWDFDGSYADWYGGHELGHTYNQPHTKGATPTCTCGTNFCPGCGCEGKAVQHYPNGNISPTQDPWANNALYGFDVETQAIYPPSWTDMMTYCDNEWISDYTYENIKWRMYHEPVYAAQTVAEARPAAAQEYLAVFGSIYTATDQVQLDTFYRVPNGQDVFGRVPGEYSIRLLDADSDLLADYPFTPRSMQSGGGPVCQASASVTDVAAMISEFVPWITNTTYIAIYHNTSALITRTVSTNAPQVTLTYPNGSEVLSGSQITVTWTASDADGDALSFTLDYSLDGGTHWRVLGSGITTTHLLLDAVSIPGTSQGKFRILASDGVNTAQDESDGTFTVPNKAPQVQLVSPSEGAKYVPGQTVALAASATDLEDGSLGDAALSWTSSLSGTMGTGRLLHVTDLVTGTHVITVTATDANGNKATATRSVYVSWYQNKIYLPLVVRNY